MILVVPLQVVLLPIGDLELNPLLTANLEVQNNMIDMLIFCVTYNKRIVQLIFKILVESMMTSPTFYTNKKLYIKISESINEKSSISK